MMKIAERLKKARMRGDPRPWSRPAITSEEIVSAALRAVEVQCITDEMRYAGLTPPVGLRCAFDLFIDGLATLEQVQAYLDIHLSAPVASLPLQTSEILGASNPVALVDQIWSDGNKVAQALIAQGGVTEISFYLAAAAVYVLVGLLCVAVAVLLAISKIAVAILLALGPLFIVMLLFDSTKRFFEQWIGLLANYGLITVLIALIAAMLLGVVRAHATAAVAAGTAVTIAEAARLCVVCVLVALLVRQVPSMAAGLAAGVALSTYSAVSRSVSWGLGAAQSTGYQGMRGVMDGLRGEPTSRWDSLRRSGGNLIGSSIRQLLGRGSKAEGGTLVPRSRVMPPPYRR